MLRYTQPHGNVHRIDARRRPGEDLRLSSGATARPWERRAWVAGVVFVAALVAEVAISAGSFLASDDAVYITGAELAIDGGHFPSLTAALPQ